MVRLQELCLQTQRVVDRVNTTPEVQFAKIIEGIDQKARFSEEAFEKLLVALTGAFRLLDGKQSMLAALQGNPEDIQVYILKLLGQVRVMVSEGYDNLKADIQIIVQQLEKV